MKNIALIALLYCVPAGYAQVPEAYVCLSELATGFIRNEKTASWDIAKFRVEKERFLVTNKGGRWSWNEFGKEDPFGDCSPPNDAGYMFCNALLTTVVFNKKNLRFQNYYQGGYISEGIPGVKTTDTPYITIGTCSRM